MPILVLVIESFKDAATSDLFHGFNTKAARSIPKALWPVASRKLDMLNAAASLVDLRTPGNNLEKLVGNREGFWSVRVNQQYRVIFRWSEPCASHDVQVLDYH